MHAAIWATSLTGAKRSSRAVSESCSVVGMASAGSGPAILYRSPISISMPPFDDGLGQFLDEQCDTIGAGEDLLQNFVRQHLAGSDPLNQCHTLAPAQA